MAEIVSGLMPPPGRMTGLSPVCDRWSNFWSVGTPLRTDVLFPLRVRSDVVSAQAARNTPRQDSCDSVNSAYRVIG